MHVQQAIRTRRAIREYTEEPVSEEVIRSLLEAAIWAPSALNAQPWAFVVIQDREVLNGINTEAVRLLSLQPQFAEYLAHAREEAKGREYDIFHGAGTLVILCAKPNGIHPEWDCCLAGQNLLLAAREMGVGSCVIGLAWEALEQPSIKAKLGIPSDCRVVLPIVLGYARETPKERPRKPAEILTWMKTRVVATI